MKSAKRYMVVAIIFLFATLTTGCVSMIHRHTGRNDIPAVQAELEKGTGIESIDSSDKTPLLLAAEKGHMEMVEYLVAQGANVNATTPVLSGEVTPLRYAIDNRDYQMVKFLIDNGADVNLSNAGGWRPIMTAARVGDRAIVDLLLDAGADLDVQDDDGKTPVRIASQNGWTDIVVYFTLKMETE